VYTNDLLSAEATFDEDDDEVDVIWSWEVNGTDIGETTAEISGETWFDKNDEVVVYATPVVEGIEGDTQSASIVVSNTAPAAPTVEIVPSAPIEGEDDLICTVTVDSSDDDPGDEAGITYAATWTVDTVSFTDTSETTFPDDTVSATETIAGQTWKCTVTPNDGDEDGATGSDEVEIGEAEADLADCSTDLDSVGAPTDVASVSGGGGHGIGAWMGDADPASTGKYWVMMDYDEDYIIEYDTYADVETGTSSGGATLSDDWAGTGHVVLNGVLYYNEEDSATLVAFDLATQTELTRADLTDAGYDNTWAYNWGGLTDIDLSVDGESLYALYSTDAAAGYMVVSELDPSTLAILDTDTSTTALKNDYTNTFIACGVVYGVDNNTCFYCTDVTIDLAWDLSTGTETDPGIDFTAPGTSGYIGSVDYNPADGFIYSMRGGTLGLSTPTWN